MIQPRHPARTLSTPLRRGWAPADPPRRPVLFVNPRSGGGSAIRHGVVELARERGVQAVTLGSGDDLRTSVREVVAQGADALGMAGGDGSLAVVAAVAAAHALPFVCVPVGTRNHFALDLGVDRHDVPGALYAFTDGVERRIDVGEVNGRIFLNNVSLGIYGEAVQQAGYRDAKVRTSAETARRVLGPGVRTPGLRLVDDAGGVHARVAVLLVSNNPYALTGPGSGTRPTLTAVNWGFSSSTDQMRDTPPDGPGALQTSRSRPQERCMRASTVRLSNSLVHSSSAFNLRPCASASQRVIPEPRPQPESLHPGRLEPCRLPHPRPPVVR